MLTPDTHDEAMPAANATPAKRPDSTPAERVQHFLSIDPRATICGRTNGPDGPMELTIHNLHAVLTGRATKAQAQAVRAFLSEFDPLRDTDHPLDNDHVWTAHGGVALHGEDVWALLDDLDEDRDDPSDVLPVSLDWSDNFGEYRLRREQIGPLLVYIENLAAEND